MIKLTDAGLITNLRECLPDLGYRHRPRKEDRTTYETKIGKILQHIEGAIATTPKNFSLFEYSAQHVDKENEDTVFDLWREAFIGALHLLKVYDRRENPNQDGYVTAPNVEELIKYYKALRKDERILYGIERWYRDHFVHVLRVWLVGLFLFNKKKVRIKPPRVTGDEGVDGALFSNYELCAMFTVAALTHDMGYPLEKVTKVNTAVSNLLDTFGGLELEQLVVRLSMAQHNTAQDVLKLLASKPSFRTTRNLEISLARIKKELEPQLQKDRAGNNTPRQQILENLTATIKRLGWGMVLRCQWKFYQKYARSFEKTQHGFISALLLQRKLLFFREGEFANEEDYRFNLEEIRQFMIRREILRAVATHTCDDIYFLSDLTLEAMLFFCDEIQDWGRPNFSDLYRRAANGRFVTLMNYSEAKVEWSVDISNIKVWDYCEIFLSTGRSLYNRLRGAPDSIERKFGVAWKFSLIDKGTPIQGVFEFDKDSRNYKYEIQGINALDILYGLVTGECNREFAIRQLEKKIKGAKKKRVNVKAGSK